MKLSRTHIALLIGVAMLIITINASYRVRYFGQLEAQRRAEEAADAGADSGDAGATAP